jgi:RHS repeat-associated protein
MARSRFAPNAASALLRLPNRISYNYTFDAMGRTNQMTGLLEGGPSYPLTLGSATYGIANELLSFQGDTRTYNNMYQLTRISAGGMDVEYIYRPGQNNGRIVEMKDHVTGEDVTYAYDTLNRLVSAVSTGVVWSRTWSYDGFGNRTGAADPLTNRPVNGTDANGNPTQYYVCGPTYTCPEYPYDVENHVLRPDPTPGTGTWSYDGKGKRIFWYVAGVLTYNANPPTTCEIYFYGIGGQKLATYSCGYDDQTGGTGNFWWQMKDKNLYFLGKLIKAAGQDVTLDRLGSVRLRGSQRFSYYPYGDERTPTANGMEKFGTYFRDATGMDYADQRYYSSNTGSFFSPDPENSGDLNDPNSLNLYSYALNDPVNFNDPTGLDVNIPLQNGGDPNSCLNHSLIPWFNQHGINIGDNFGNFGNTNLGILSLTLYYEDTHGSTLEYEALAQVFANRYHLEASNPSLAQSLFGSIGTSIKNVVENSSNEWNNGNLNSEANLETLIDSNVVGASNAVAASACNGLVSAMNVASDALTKAFGSTTFSYGVGQLSTSTYWFFNVGTKNPVNTNYWNIVAWTQPGFAFAFDNLIGAKPPAPSPTPGHPHRPPRRGGNPGAPIKKPGGN